MTDDQNKHTLPSTNSYKILAGLMTTLLAIGSLASLSTTAWMIVTRMIHILHGSSSTIHYYPFLDILTMLCMSAISAVLLIFLRIYGRLFIGLMWE